MSRPAASVRFVDHPLLRWLTDLPARVPAAWRPCVPPLLGLLLWVACTAGPATQPTGQATPAAVAAAAWALLASADFWADLGASVQRALLGLVLGAVAGVAVGVALGGSMRAERLLGPSLHALKQVSLFAWLPLLALAFGLGETAKVAFIALAVFYPVLLNTAQGVRDVPPAWLELAQALQYGRWQRLHRVVCPAALPSVFTGLQLAVVYAWLATLGAEYLMPADAGIGHWLTDARDQWRLPDLLCSTAVVVLTGAVMNAVVVQAERWCLRPAWRADPGTSACTAHGGP